MVICHAVKEVDDILTTGRVATTLLSACVNVVEQDGTSIIVVAGGRGVGMGVGHCRRAFVLFCSGNVKLVYSFVGKFLPPSPPPTSRVCLLPLYCVLTVLTTR